MRLQIIHKLLLLSWNVLLAWTIGDAPVSLFWARSLRLYFSTSQCHIVPLGVFIWYTAHVGTGGDVRDSPAPMLNYVPVTSNSACHIFLHMRSLATAETQHFFFFLPVSSFFVFLLETKVLGILCCFAALSDKCVLSCIRSLPWMFFEDFGLNFFTPAFFFFPEGISKTLTRISNKRCVVPCRAVPHT